MPNADSLRFYSRTQCSGVLLQHYYASLVRSHPSYTLAEAAPGLPAAAATIDPSQPDTSTDADGDAQMNLKPAATQEAVRAPAKGEATWTPSGGLHADAAHQASPMAAETRTAQQRWPQGSVNSDVGMANGRTRATQSAQGHASGVG